MPRSRTYNRRALVRALAERHDVYFHRSARSHDEYRRDAPGGTLYAGYLPRHQNVPEGTVKSFLNQLGIAGSVRRALGLLGD